MRVEKVIIHGEVRSEFPCLVRGRHSRYYAVARRIGISLDSPIDISYIEGSLPNTSLSIAEFRASYEVMPYGTGIKISS